ncbi:MAG TPA: hypothetical protein VJS69_06720 [Candidatus Krumholzibacteria bacterium]|nr:hypothetical protein [Candidatus Krumholzibacteria bacterium]
MSIERQLERELETVDYAPFPEPELMEMADVFEQNSRHFFEWKRWALTLRQALAAHTAVRERMLLAELRMSLPKPETPDESRPV